MVLYVPCFSVSFGGQNYRGTLFFFFFFNGFCFLVYFFPMNLYLYLLDARGVKKKKKGKSRG